MAVKDLEKERAIFAYQCVEKANSDKGLKDDYKSYVKKIPTMILTNGLGATFAFIYSKNGKAYELVMENQSIDNFHLKFNKFSKFNYKDGYKLQYQGINENFFNKNWNFYHSKIKSYYENIQKLNLNFSEPIDLDIHYRLLIGAEQSIYETSIRLHHIYGIPYIPSSAIKGVVKSHIEQLKKLDSFIDMFGTEEQEGKIVFFDTFPISEPKIKMDIINPMQEDKIINFLTIENTTFQFLIGFKDEKDENFINLFKEALTEHGIGAKTAVGYGYFKETS